MKKSIIYGVALALAGGLTACESYLDINDDPNNVTESKVTTSDVFPGCEGAFINTYGGTWNYMGAFMSEMYAQSASVWQWGQFGRFQVTSSDSESGYSNVYVGMLTNLDLVMKIAEDQEDWGTYLAAKVLRVAGLQMIVDAFGKAPYTEATDLTVTNPVWDEGDVVYQGLIAELDEALGKPIVGGSNVAKNLLLPGKSASEWVKLANALKLRLLMRISNVMNVQSQVAALVSDDNFPADDVKWAGFWTNAVNKCNPLYGQFTNTGSREPWCQMNIASQRVYEKGGDARMERYFAPGESGNYVGWLSGVYPTNQFAESYRDATVSKAIMTYDMPVYLITVAEIEFFKAEYEARYGTASAAKTHYENAIRASFSKTAGLDESGANSVIAAWPYDNANYAKCIGIQKWIHLTAVNGFEGWCELRRLRYPAFGSVQGDDLISRSADATVNVDLLVPGDIYTPPSWERNPDMPANTLVERWPYPSNSLNNNTNKPNVVPITTKVFWAQ